MVTRYDRRRLILNDDELYWDMLQRRHVNYIRQYASGVLHYPTFKDLQSITKIPHIWSTGDRFYKLASQHYGTPTYWWVIALFNQAPTEASLFLGKQIFVPMPLEAILRVYNRK